MKAFPAPPKSTTHKRRDFLVYICLTIIFSIAVAFLAIYIKFRNKSKVPTTQNYIFMSTTTESLESSSVSANKPLQISESEKYGLEDFLNLFKNALQNAVSIVETNNTVNIMDELSKKNKNIKTNYEEYSKYTQKFLSPFYDEEITLSAAQTPNFAIGYLKVLSIIIETVSFPNYYKLENEIEWLKSLFVNVYIEFIVLYLKKVLTLLLKESEKIIKNLLIENQLRMDILNGYFNAFKETAQNLIIVEKTHLEFDEDSDVDVKELTLRNFNLYEDFVCLCFYQVYVLLLKINKDSSVIDLAEGMKAYFTKKLYAINIRTSQPEVFSLTPIIEEIKEHCKEIFILLNNRFKTGKFGNEWKLYNERCFVSVLKLYPILY